MGAAQDGIQWVYKEIFTNYLMQPVNKSIYKVVTQLPVHNCILSTYPSIALLYAMVSDRNLGFTEFMPVFKSIDFFRLSIYCVIIFYF